VATILSAQCTDERVNAVTPALFSAAPDPSAMAALGPEGIEPLIRTCGLFRNKAKNIHRTSQALVRDHEGEVPGDRAALVSLPGVGRKTANVVLANAFGEDAIAVDTHVFRVSRRLGLATGSTPAKVERELMEILPKDRWAPTHHRLILHGRALCTARNPRCGECPLSAWCDWYRAEAASSGAG